MGVQNKKQKEYLDEISAMMRAAAKPVQIDVNDLGDCLQDYEAKRIVLIKSPPDNWESAAMLSALKRDIIWHMRGWLRNQRRSKRRLESLDQLASDVEVGSLREPASPLPGPEEIVLNLEAERNLAAIEECLSSNQRRLWKRHVIDGVKLVDLAEEFEKSANSLRQTVYIIRRKLRKKLQEQGAIPKSK